jgi:hypothetical protein
VGCLLALGVVAVLFLLPVLWRLLSMAAWALIIVGVGFGAWSLTGDNAAVGLAAMVGALWLVAKLRRR